MLASTALVLSLIAAGPSNNDPGAAPASGATVKSQRAAKHAAESAAAQGANGTVAAAAAAQPASVSPAYRDAPVVATPAPAAAGSATSASGSNSAIDTASAALNGTALGGLADSPAHSSGFPLGSMFSVFLFGICGAAALIFMRKKQAVASRLQILETHSLGGKRALIVAQLAGETLLLGSSESGLSLLSTRQGEIAPQAAFVPQGAPRADAPAGRGRDLQADIASALSNSWLGKLSLARPPQPQPSFEELLERDNQIRSQSRGPRATAPLTEVEPAILRTPIDPLAESAEDTELRRKLAAGRGGRIA